MKKFFSLLSSFSNYSISVGTLRLSEAPFFLPRKMYLQSLKNKLVTTYDTSCRLAQIALTLACQFLKEFVNHACDKIRIHQLLALFLSHHKIWYIKIHSLYTNLRKEVYENIPFIWLVIAGPTIRAILDWWLFWR